MTVQWLKTEYDQWNLVCGGHIRLNTYEVAKKPVKVSIVAQNNKLIVELAITSAHNL